MSLDVGIFSYQADMDMDSAKDFVSETHYRTIFTCENTWRDPNTGRISMFEASRKSSIII